MGSMIGETEAKTSVFSLFARDFLGSNWSFLDRAI